jgi:hypothetical protein
VPAGWHPEDLLHTRAVTMTVQANLRGVGLVASAFGMRCNDVCREMMARWAVPRWSASVPRCDPSTLRGDLFVALWLEDNHDQKHKYNAGVKEALSREAQRRFARANGLADWLPDTAEGRALACAKLGALKPLVRGGKRGVAVVLQFQFPDPLSTYLSPFPCGRQRIMAAVQRNVGTHVLQALDGLYPEVPMMALRLRGGYPGSEYPFKSGVMRHAMILNVHQC